VASVGLTTLAACSSDRADGKGDEQRTGTLALALQSTAPSGSVYRLRSAFFQITNIRTGITEAFLSSDDGLPEAAELNALLPAGSYTVTLLPGWFLERISGSGGGSGGAPGGFGGTSTAGTGPIPGAGGEGEFPVPDIAGDPGEAGAAAGGVFTGVGGEGPIGPTAGKSAGGSVSTGGSGIIGGSGSTGGGTIVDAHLVNDAVQFFFLVGGGDAFVNYQFKVGGEVVDFTKGKVHVFISVDDSEACQVPDDVTRPERVLLETNVDAVGGVDLASVFKALATNGGHNGDGNLLYQQIFDSYATADQALLPNAIHCGDETTNGVPTLNGFPIDCNRAEAQHVNDMNNFFATAFVNRIDLAPANGAHCGQQRMIFANSSRGRTFMILEAQIPNPQPELGIDGCRPLAQFWLDQNNEPNAKVRGQRLAQAFLQGGVNGLTEFGFGPFYTAENLTVGSGQIRTNQFDSKPWTLREFKLALDGDTLSAIPFPTAESPNGQLWNETNPLPQGEACRENFLGALDGVLTNDMSIMSFIVDSACKDGESREDTSENYARELGSSPGFRSQLEERLLSVGSKLSPEDVANRARFSGSCIGCHNEASGASLGDGVFAPFSNDFPQVVEFSQPCGNGETGDCFTKSNALNTVFLPGRLAVLSNLLGVPIVPNPCNGGGGGGVGGSSGMGGGFGTAGTTSVGGSSSMGNSPGTGGIGVPDGGKGNGGATTPMKPLPSEPAPVVVIELPSAAAPVGELQAEEQVIRDEYGDVTISGKSAKSTH
jgi:hypothetical protein